MVADQTIAARSRPPGYCPFTRGAGMPGPGTTSTSFAGDTAQPGTLGRSKLERQMRCASISMVLLRPTGVQRSTRFNVLRRANQSSPTAVASISPQDGRAPGARVSGTATRTVRNSTARESPTGSKSFAERSREPGPGDVRIGDPRSGSQLPRRHECARHVPGRSGRTG